MRPSGRRTSRIKAYEPSAILAFIQMSFHRTCMNNVLLSNLSNYRIGGAAEILCRARDRDDVVYAVTRAARENLPIFVLGGGTNLLISDEGVRGMVLKPEMDVLAAEGTIVRAGAGVSMAELLECTIARGLSGLEWAGGLPGTVGGAIRGNAGAFGGEIKDAVRTVISLSLCPGKAEKTRTRRSCRFGYRTSVFKEQGGEVIVEAEFALRRGDRKAIRDAVEEKIRYRRDRHPLEYPNIGSIFKNVDVRSVPPKVFGAFEKAVKTDPFPVVPVAALIDRAGLKGVSCGGAMISPQHPNFIVNVLHATAADVKTLIALVKFTIKKRFGVALEEEIMYVGV